VSVVPVLAGVEVVVLDAQLVEALVSELLASVTATPPVTAELVDADWVALEPEAEPVQATAAAALKVAVTGGASVAVAGNPVVTTGPGRMTVRSASFCGLAPAVCFGVRTLA
jgi:hypothetical protein